MRRTSLLIKNIFVFEAIVLEGPEVPAPYLNACRQQCMHLAAEPSRCVLQVFGQPPGSLVLQTLFSRPEDACATTVHAVASPNLAPGAYCARGLFASPVIVSGFNEPLAGLASCMDAPLRHLSQGVLCAEISEVPVAPAARDPEQVSCSSAFASNIDLWAAAKKRCFPYDGAHQRNVARCCSSRSTSQCDCIRQSKSGQ